MCRCRILSYVSVLAAHVPMSYIVLCFWAGRPCADVVYCPMFQCWPPMCVCRILSYVSVLAAHMPMSYILLCFSAGRPCGDVVYCPMFQCWPPMCRCRILSYVSVLAAHVPMSYIVLCFSAGRPCTDAVRAALRLGPQQSRSVRPLDGRWHYAHSVRPHHLAAWTTSVRVHQNHGYLLISPHMYMVYFRKT